MNHICFMMFISCDAYTAYNSKALAVALKQATAPEFKTYTQQVGFVRRMWV